MTVFIEPLKISHGPIVYILTRRVGSHLDIETMPDSINNDRKAHEYAAMRWGVPECDITWKEGQVINLGDEP